MASFQNLRPRNDSARSFKRRAKPGSRLRRTSNQCLESAKTSELDESLSQKLYSDLHRFTARLVLFCGITEKGRRDILHSLGFDIQSTVEGVTFNQMTLIFLVLLSVTVTGLLCFTGSKLELFETRLLKGIMISAILAIITSSSANWV